MTDQLDYSAKLNAKGLDTTGVVEEIARDMALNIGGHTLLLIDAEHAEVTRRVDGSTVVKLRAVSVEPIPAAQEDAARRFLRALHLSHPAQRGQQALQGTNPGPTVEDAERDLAAQVQHDPDGNPTGVWNGDPEDAGDDGLPDDDKPWPGDEAPKDVGAGQVVKFSSKR